MAETNEEVKVNAEATEAANIEPAVATTDSNETKETAAKDETTNNSNETDNTKSTTELEDKIIRQVEYYFGDFNLPRDKFLLEQIKLDDGWIPLTTMLKFARLSVLSKNPQVIINALKKSTSGLMETSAGSSKIRRATPIPAETEEWKSSIDARTVYCKGFPKEGMSIDKLLEYFQKYPTVQNIRMRYYNTKDEETKFKGTALITFSQREEAEKFMTLDTVKYNDYTLQRQWSLEWKNEKEMEYQQRKLRREMKPSTDENGNGTKDENKDKDKDSDSKKIVLPRGTVLKLVNMPSGVDRDEIRTAFNSYPADIAFVEITPENTAFVRLRAENDAKLVLEKLVDNKISIGDASIEVSLLAADEEDEYVKKAEEFLNRAQNFRARGNGRGRGRGRGRGGRGGRGGYKGQKRSGSPSGSRGDRAKQGRSE